MLNLKLSYAYLSFHAFNCSTLLNDGLDVARKETVVFSCSISLANMLHITPQLHTLMLHYIVNMKFI